MNGSLNIIPEFVGSGDERDVRAQWRVDIMYLQKKLVELSAIREKHELSCVRAPVKCLLRDGRAADAGYTDNGSYSLTVSEDGFSVSTPVYDGSGKKIGKLKSPKVRVDTALDMLPSAGSYSLTSQCGAFALLGPIEEPSIFRVVK
jgi:hypothetical protein